MKTIDKNQSVRSQVEDDFCLVMITYRSCQAKFPEILSVPVRKPVSSLSQLFRRLLQTLNILRCEPVSVLLFISRDST